LQRGSAEEPAIRGWRAPRSRGDRRDRLKRGVVTLSIGGGQGIALALGRI
jgi:acetyl-CoA acetyltransferase